MEKHIRQYMLALSIVLMLSLIYSKFLLSVSMIGFVILALACNAPSYRFWNNRAFLLVSLFFFLFVFSGINSSNTGDWVHHMRMRLPFIALPFAFYAFPALDKKMYYLLHKIFIAIIAFSTLPVLWNIVVDFDQVYKDLAQGRPIATPVHHVKYSIFLAFAAISGAYLAMKDATHKHSREKWVLSATTIYLTLFLHVLAVRSGIAVLYISILILALAFAVKARKFKYLLMAIGFSVIMPVLAYQLVPSLNKRINYMVYDLNEYIENGGDNYSDSDRINSLIVGYKIFNRHPIAGIGIGDIKDACTDQYLVDFGPDKYVLYPHNQYLFILVSTGILGLLVFLTALWGPLFLQSNYRGFLLLALVVIYSTAFLADNILERSFSAAFYAFFLCAGLSFRKGMVQKEHL
jgi:O-antigen ligase